MPSARKLRRVQQADKLQAMAKAALSLSELIEHVKQELLRNHDASQPLFAVSEVEINITVTAERNVSGGIDLQVVQLGGARASSETHEIRVKLAPLATVEAARARLTAEQQAAAEDAITRTYRSNLAGS
jgi:methyl coenzyme M reductase subunit C-like uncharacterized protein (methanogenesis marker protein 7)